MWNRILTYAVIVTVVVTALAAGLLWLADRWWLGTVVAYAPRWLWGLPLPVLLIATLVWQRWKLLGLVGLATLVFGFLILGCELPSPFAGGAPDRLVRVMTSNIGGGPPVSIEFLVRTLEEAGVDVAAFQECKTEWAPASTHAWHTHSIYGMCLFSRFPIRKVDVRDPRDMWQRNGAGLMIRYELESPLGTIDVVNVHLETVREGMDEVLRRLWRGAPEMRKNIEQRRFESEVARAFVQASPAPVIVIGDFNLPVESGIYRASWTGLTNAFSSAGFGLGYTKHTSWHGIRIDHVLLGPGLRPVRAWVGETVVGYDHTPMLADVALAANAARGHGK